MMIKRGISQLIEIIESRVFDVSEQNPKREEEEQERGGRTLLPPLSDEFVFSRIWPLLHRGVNISLLWRLRRVNRAWKEKVATTKEWAALEMVRVDSPGFLLYIAARREPRPSLRERVENELSALSILLAEDLVSFTGRSESVQLVADRLEPVRGGRRRVSARMLSEESESGIASSSDGSTRWRNSERYPGREEYESERSEEEEIEAYASSMDSSMRVYYPRHRVR